MTTTTESTTCTLCHGIERFYPDCDHVTPDVPAPAGAVKVGDWTLDGDDGIERGVTLTTRTVELRAHYSSERAIDVDVWADQLADGTLRYCHIAMDAMNDTGLSAQEARALASALTEAANTLERLT